MIRIPDGWSNCEVFRVNLGGIVRPAEWAKDVRWDGIDGWSTPAGEKIMDVI